jgi:hypothetical protein
VSSRVNNQFKEYYNVLKKKSEIKIKMIMTMIMRTIIMMMMMA